MDEPLTTPVETEITPPEAERVREHKAPAEGGKKPGNKGIVRDFATGMLVAIVALTLKMGFEHTDLGEQVQTSAYNYLQLRLATPGLGEPLPVAVVDISQLETVSVTTDDWTRSITPRPKLLRLIESVANQGPKAIGVDIDFAPDQPGYMWEDDPDFFQSCLEISTTTGVPIFLGVRRSQDLPPEAWLGSPSYKSLAATISVRLLDGRRVPQWMKRDGDSEAGQSLSAALAKFLPKLGNTLPAWTEGIIKQVTQADVPNKHITFGEFLVDYGFLDAIRDKTLRTINPTVIEDQGPWLLKGKVVLLGDASIGKADTSGVPSQNEPVPGVYLHACAVYTLTHPLYELTGWGRTAIDLTLSALLIGIVAAIRVRARNSELDLSLVQGFLTSLIVLLAFVVGIVFVRRTRIMWDDFILAIGVLIMHPSIEKWWNLVRSKIMPSVKTFFSKK